MDTEEDTMSVETSKNVVHRTGHVDRLWGEIIVLAAYSDWNEKGWMVCHEFIREGVTRASYHPLVFFREGDRGAAIEYADGLGLDLSGSGKGT